MHINLIARAAVATLPAWLILTVAGLLPLAVLAGLLEGVLIGPLVESAIRIASTDPHNGKIG
jgi:hypothetical protein